MRAFYSLNPWKFSTIIFSICAFAPVVVIGYLALFPSESIWEHLLSTSLPRYLINTSILMMGVGVSVFLTGVSTAWLVTTYTFPGRNMLEWLLLLPLSVPAYVIAYLYTDLLEYSGPVQSVLRAWFDWELASDYWFPTIRSMGGAIALMGLVLYPYVYLMARSSFLEQSPHLSDVSRLMGKSRLKTFFSVSLPIARPGITIGVALALMETLNDFGTVDFFAVPTLTAGLFDVWLNMNNLGGAAQIAMVMLSFVLILLGIEHINRNKMGFFQKSGRFVRQESVPLSRLKGWLVFGFCMLPITLGFILPMWLLLNYAMSYFEQSWTSSFRSQLFNSLSVSALAALFCTLLGISISYTKRIYPRGKTAIISKLASLGYAVPGAVLAVGVVIPLASLDNTVDQFMRQTFDISSGLLLTGSLFVLVMAYVIRFLAITIGSIESSFSKISESMDMASRTLGNSPAKTLVKYHFPLIKSGILTATLIVFVDCMKELPATLLLRPFNFDTLATQVYLFASDELIELSALGALFIVLAGLIPVIILSKTISYSQTLHQQD